MLDKEVKGVCGEISVNSRYLPNFADLRLCSMMSEPDMVRFRRGRPTGLLGERGTVSPAGDLNLNRS
jgi:hypothetical protein